MAVMLALLLASAIRGEWVEISQHQHRPPSHRTALEDLTSANKIYANYSATERPWQRSGLTRVPNFGSVKKVQLQTKEKATFSNGVPAKINQNRRFESFGPVRAPNINIKENFDLTNDKIKSNLDNIKDNLGKSNNKSKTKNPYLNVNADNDKSFSNNHNNEFQEYIQTPGKNKFQEISVTHNRDHKTGNERRVYTKSSQSGSDSGAEEKVRNTNEDTNRNFETTEEYESTRSEKFRNNNVSFGNTTKTFYEKTPQIPNSSKSVNKHFHTYSFDKNIGQIERENVTVFNISEHGVDDETDRNNLNIEHDDIQNEKVLENNSKTNPVEVIWKLMKVVTDNISRNTRRSFKSKVRYLESLRNNIIMNIGERIEQAWPDDAAAGAEGARRKRAARGHVEFPSSESALMTISFLTFAVFLIKLVLQVIHTYKNKTMMVTPAVVAAVGRAAAALKTQTHD